LCDGAAAAAVFWWVPCARLTEKTPVHLNKLKKADDSAGQTRRLTESWSPQQRISSTMTYNAR
jgi:hypothetical protein